MPLLGQLVKLDPGENKCEEHPEVDAVVERVNECDSFGCDTTPMCKECKDEYLLELEKNPSVTLKGKCHICKTYGTVTPKKDPEEGFAGRYYDLCDNCLLDW